MNIREAITDTLEQCGIDEIGFLDYKYVREINTRLISREGFTPRSVIMFLVPYYAGATENLSVYAAGPDYHTVIKRITDRVISAITECRPEASAKGFGDHSPIDERHAALLAGLGILGKNGLIINRTYGSYVFIGDIITDISAEEMECDLPKETELCEDCGRCREACPTGILRGESSECLSAITQTKGELSDGQIALMKKYDTCWGCDICSAVCPYNRSVRMTPVEDFYEGRISRLTKDAVEAMSEGEFSSRAFAWRGRKSVLRNLEYLYGGDNGENKT